MGRTREGGNESAVTGQLDRLREHERTLAEQLQRARSEAERIVQDEQDRARAARERLEAEIREEEEKLRRVIRADADDEVRNVLAEARARARRMEDVPEPRVRELAESVFRRLLAVGDVT
jgi:vacuolar-type H+-ATPase subunit H